LTALDSSSSEHSVISDSDETPTHFPSVQCINAKDHRATKVPNGWPRLLMHLIANDSAYTNSGISFDLHLQLGILKVWKCFFHLQLKLCSV